MPPEVHGSKKPPSALDSTFFIVLLSPIALFAGGLYFVLKFALYVSPLVAFACSVLGATAVGERHGSWAGFLAFLGMVSGYC